MKFPPIDRRAVFVLIGVGVLCGGLVAYNLLGGLFGGGTRMMRPPVVVEAATVAAAPWTPGVDAVGTARAVEGVDLSVEVAGVVKEILFASNGTTEKDQLLVQIDDAVERADIIAAEANVKLYKRQADRAAELRQRGASSQAAYEDALAQLDVARSTLARLQAVLDQKAITAPFAGVLGIVRVDVGQYVQPGTVVVTLQSLDRMKVDFTVPEQAAAALRVGQTARFGVAAGDMPFTGRILGVDPKVDSTTRLVFVQAEIDNPAGHITPGQFLRVRVDLPTEQNVIALAQTAVVPSLYGDYVFVVEQAAADAPPGLVIRQAFVKLGRRDGTRVEIVEGLSPGQVVVASGQNRLQNGAHVSIAPTTAPVAAVPGTRTAP